jgi:hypothetical protein
MPELHNENPGVAPATGHRHRQPRTVDLPPPMRLALRELAKVEGTNLRGLVLQLLNGALPNRLRHGAR